MTDKQLLKFLWNEIVSIVVHSKNNELGVKCKTLFEK